MKTLPIYTPSLVGYLSILILVFVTSGCVSKDASLDFTINKEQVISVNDIAGQPTPSELDKVISLVIHQSAVFKPSFNEAVLKDETPIWQWNFGDGTDTLTSKDWIFHRFKSTGMHEVELCLNEQGCVSKFVFVEEVAEQEEEVVVETIDRTPPPPLSKKKKPFIQKPSYKTKVFSNQESTTTSEFSSKQGIVSEEPPEKKLMEELMKRERNNATNMPFDRNSYPILKGKSSKPKRIN